MEDLIGAIFEVEVRKLSFRSHVKTELENRLPESGRSSKSADETASIIAGRRSWDPSTDQLVSMFASVFACGSLNFRNLSFVLLAQFSDVPTIAYKDDKLLAVCMSNTVRPSSRLFCIEQDLILESLASGELASIIIHPSL